MTGIKSTESDSSSREDANKSLLAELRVQRGTVQGQLTKMKNMITAKADTMTVHELDTRLGVVENYFDNFNKIQTRLECLDPVETSSDDGKRGAFEEAYIEIKSKILQHIAKKRPRTSLTIGDANLTLTSIKQKNKSLPKLKLSKFNGKYSEWSDFISMFENLVHNDDDLSDIEKHLKSCLTDSALLSISSIEVKGENYENALNLLKRRFENKRLIFQEHISEIFNIKVVEKNSFNQLRSLSDSVNSHFRALLSLGSKDEIADALLIHVILSKLDFATRAKWEDEVADENLPKWEQLVTCIERRCVALENLDQGKRLTPPTLKSNAYSSNSKKIYQTKGSALITAGFKLSCESCMSSEHSLQSCPNFKILAPTARFNEVKRLNLCINCLKRGHSVKNCKSGRCRICSFKHHTLLHMGSSPNQDQNSVEIPHASVPCTSQDDQEHIAGVSHSIKAPQSKSSLTTIASSDNQVSFRCSRGHVFLATALVDVMGSNGVFVSCRALLDSASQLNFATERLAQKLRIKKMRVNIALNGISNTCTTVKNLINVTVRSRCNDYITAFDAYVLPEITGNQPDSFVDISHWDIPENVASSLADPNFNKPEKIDLLIGAGLFFELLAIGQIRLGQNMPILQKTLLGWIISGPSPNFLSTASCFTTTNVNDESSTELDHILRKFWEIEGYEDHHKALSPEEQECEEHFVTTYRRLDSGHFRVSLPFREHPSVLGNSFEASYKRFLNLESRLLKSLDIFEEYTHFIKEYLELNHMEPVKLQDLPPQHYFLPHHCVQKPKSSSIRLRVVFDASCRTTSGRSLNDILMVGPNLQNDLYTILLRFRTFRYAITADITKMYRQVSVTDPDTYLQCIIWRENKAHPIQVYRLTTVTYGTAPAAFLSTRCLIQLSQDEALKFPIGSRTVRSSFYVDDMLAGADSIEETIQIKNETDELLKKGGFVLRKWCSNHKDILSKIPENDLEKLVEIDGNSTIKTLGLTWMPATDEFRYSHSSINNLRCITKRSVLSIIARLFDPLGLLNPLVVKAKIFMQNLWALGLSWDESLPQVLHTEWINFCEQLDQINNIRIPRYAVFRNSDLEIHGFADASTKAYGACVYSKSIDSLGNHVVQLLTAKSRVAPVKPVTIPRLELCAALLLSELLNRVLATLQIESLRVFCWSDSKIVLAWIASTSNVKQPIFIANRVAKINDLTKGFHWRYIETHSNPADLVSRGLFAAELVQCSRWFNGPDFLRSNNTYPTLDISHMPSLIVESDTHANSFVASKANATEDLIERCAYKNSFIRLQNVFAYILRFYNNSRGKEEKIRGDLSVYELERALKVIIRTVQESAFSSDYIQLRHKRPLHNHSAIKDLHPFVDNDGIIRIGGRLKNSNLSFDARHQILLPKSHSLTKCVISYYHLKNMHAGCQTLLSIIRTKYWPIEGKNTVKEVIHRCIRCFRSRPRSVQQIMGDLPADRVRASRPFNCTGIDFCGPFFTTYLIRGRGPSKAYICLFICFATKAVHLEVVSNLSAEAFLAALKRFIARRGKVSRIWSDNATNFVGANNQLKELRSLFQSQRHNEILQQMCREDGIEWKFIPPRSPHFGGLWEASIKSAKHLIRRVAFNSSFTLEELTTFACEAEAIINSRPLTPISNDPNDLEVLTPGHFLIGGPLVSIPEPDRTEVNIDRLTRWQRISFVKQHFWLRWSREYLQSLQQRHKWKIVKPNIAINSMVLIKDSNLPPLKWPIGRVLDVYTGEDGYVRVAAVKTANGIKKRAVTELCLLPLEEKDAES